MTAGPIYLDNAATTRPLPAVVAAMADAALDAFGNPSSPHAFGPPARKLLEDAREFLRGTLSAGRIVFTSGGSEADYLGIVGSAARRSPGRIVMAASDHPALLRTDALSARWRHRTTVLPVTRDGDLAPEVLFEALGADVRTVALMHGHNELGTLSRLGELIELVRRAAPEAHVHVDLVQTYTKLPFDMDDFGVDSIAVSGHKFHGPRGAGFLALANTAELAPLQLAGGQELGLRGGTENVAGAVGLAVAAEAALSHQATTTRHCEALAEHVHRRIAEVVPGCVRLGHAERRLPHVLSLRLPGIVGQTLLERCNARGVAFSTGSACHGADDGKAQNHVLAAIGLDRRAAREVVRLSFSRLTTTAEADTAATILAEEIARMVKVAPTALFGEGIR
ncbi:MAG: aminotransferase class V-fold PLP-dependent enzyme [Planctomycetes bacterium]|nr:aminotransferase class V-fold PLP-dependent enzyme [Planctomycetota bacterium]